MKSLYSHLERDALTYEYPHEIGQLFQKLRDLKHKEKKFDEAEKAQWEVDFFTFVIKHGKLHWQFSGTNDKGEVVKYPTLDRFDERTYEYLIERLNSTSDPLLKARYAHILWSGPMKHTKYAEVAVNFYLKLVSLYEAKHEEEPQAHYGLDVITTITNAYSIACQTKHGIDEIKSELRRLVNTFSFESSSSFALRHGLIELMLKGKREFFKNEDFLGFDKICWRLSKSLTRRGNIHSAIDMLELGEEVDHRLGQETHCWRKEIAESYEMLTKQGEKDNNSAALTFCQLALENYKRIKDEEKIKKLEKKYSELKNSMRFAEIRTEIDSTEHIKRYRDIAAKVIQNETEELIKILMLDKSLLPKYRDMEKIAEEHSKQFVLQHFVPAEIIDQSGHPAEHFSDGDEKKYFGILQKYKWELELNKIYLINEIFFAAIRENKLSSEILLRFLSRNSWFGKNISRKIRNRTIKYNWLNLIAPSLHEYFIQMQYHFAHSGCPPNLVLSVDSLTLKIEGLIRDICRLSGETTFYMTKDSKNRNVVREKDIHALLCEEAIKKLFDEDDMLFLRFLLVEKAGYNLRHRVAHCLMLFQEYSTSHMHLLILALLRLGKYDFVKEESAN